MRKAIFKHVLAQWTWLDGLCGRYHRAGYEPVVQTPFLDQYCADVDA
jgi:hypothetical protein